MCDCVGVEKWQRVIDFLLILSKKVICPKKLDDPRPFKDVCANHFCASLPRTQIHVAVAPCHSLNARTEEDLQANIALLAKTTTLPGFCGLKGSVTPTFLGHIALFDKFLLIVKKWTKKSMFTRKFIFSPFSTPAPSNSAHFEALRVKKCNCLRSVLLQGTSKVEYIWLIDLPK